MELKDLYRDVILDHNRQPRNFGRIEGTDAQADGHNPLCGDRLTVFVRLNGEQVADIRFEGKGCAISTASASLMTEAVKGKDRPDPNSTITATCVATTFVLLDKPQPKAPAGRGAPPAAPKT